MAGEVWWERRFVSNMTRANEMFAYIVLSVSAWSATAAAATADIKVAKGLGIRGYDAVRVSVIDDGSAAYTHDFFA
jgi:hypothetical protein